jgi:uncharacterized protein
MRIGVVSDTHNHLGNVARIVALLNETRVDRVVHTGDITQAKTLRALAGLDAPLFGVYGNNDVERRALGAVCAELGHHFVDPPWRVTWHGRRIVVVHDPRELETLELAEVDVALYGHDHRHALERRAGILHFNPGECAGHVPGLNRVGVLDLATLEAEVLRF